MSWTKILVYYVAAALLGWHLSSTLAERTPEEVLDERPEFAFVEALASRMDRVLVEREGRRVEARRVDGRWSTVEPGDIDVPNDLYEALLDTLMTIPPIEIVSEGDDGAAPGQGDYGLMPPSSRMRIEEDGEIVASIAFGARNPTKTAVYAKKAGEDRVYLLGLSALYYLDLLFEHLDRAPAGSGAGG